MPQGIEIPSAAKFTVVALLTMVNEESFYPAKLLPNCLGVASGRRRQAYAVRTQPHFCNGRAVDAATPFPGLMVTPPSGALSFIGLLKVLTSP